MNKKGMVAVAGVAAYEIYALTGRAPTISGHVKQMARHKSFRFAVMFGLGYAVHHLLVGNDA